MQTKPEDRPKIIGLAIGIVLALALAVVRLAPALTGKDAAASNTANAAQPAIGTSVTPAAATGATVANATDAMGATNAMGAANPGQMRRFDDTIDTDAPVGPGDSFGGHKDAFRVIAAPIQVAEVKPQMTRVLPIRQRPIIPDFTGPYTAPTPPRPVIRMVAATPLEVVLDGVYQAGQERVAQLTIVGKDGGGKNGDARADQTVYRRVGEYIGRFRIARLTDTGLELSGQRLPWVVGATEKLDEGLVPAPQGSGGSGPARALPVLLPR